MYSLEKLVYESSIAADTGSLQNNWTDFVHSFGADGYHVAYGSLQVQKQRTHPVGISHNNAPGWREYYREHGLHRYDPLLAKALAHRGPFTMEEAMAEYNSPEAKRVIAEGREFGLTGSIGMTLVIGPGRGAAISLFCPTAGIHLDDTTRMMLQTASYVFCARHQELATNLSITEEPLPKLTPRELDVLRWIALGKTKHEIAERLQVSTSCIKRHCENASLKLEVNNMASAVARAMSYGLIVI